MATLDTVVSLANDDAPFHVKHSCTSVHNFLSSMWSFDRGLATTPSPSLSLTSIAYTRRRCSFFSFFLREALLGATSWLVSSSPTSRSNHNDVVVIFSNLWLDDDDINDDCFLLPISWFCFRYWLLCFYLYCVYGCWVWRNVVVLMVPKMEVFKSVFNYLEKI